MGRFNIGCVLALSCFALTSASAQMTEFKFPLKEKGFTSPMTAPISGVFDHSFAGAEKQLPKTISPDDKDSLVVAFTNERGDREPLYEPKCYQQAKNAQNEVVLFSLVGRYSNAFYPNPDPSRLCYDNHRGIDYPVKDKTPVYAAVSGLISYPDHVVGLGDDQVKNGAVLELVPYPPLLDVNYRIYYLHLSTDGQAQKTNGKPRVAHTDSTGGICPPTVYLPLEEGTPVYAGCLIGLSGNTGVVCSPAPCGYHLHFEVHKLVPKTDPSLTARAGELFGCSWIDPSLACVPVDPYGWGAPPLRYESDDPYVALTGVKNDWLWGLRPPTGLDATAH